jgi:hypothetical protein
MNHFSPLSKLQVTYWSQPRKLSRLTKDPLQRASDVQRVILVIVIMIPDREWEQEGAERFSSTRGLTCAIRKSMLSRIIISTSMAAALFIAPVGLAARSCILSSAPSQKACQSSCCPNKTCCATPPKNTAPPSQPLAKGDFSQQLKATGFVTALCFSSCEARTERFRLEARAPSANSPPRLALLCTLLI